MEIAARLQSLRGPLTKSQFARKLGLSPQTYQNYERGRIPSHTQLLKIAETLGVSLDYLLGRAPISAPRSAEGAEQAPSLPPPAPSPQLLREPRAEYSAISPPPLESRVAFLETQCAAIAPQLDEIRRLLVSLLAEGHSRDSSPVATKERVG